MNSIPLRDNILVSKEDQTPTSKGGIILAGTNDNYITGTVLAVGTGQLADNGTRVTPAVHVGDKVLFPKNAAAEIKIEGDTVYCIAEKHLMCVLK